MPETQIAPALPSAVDYERVERYMCGAGEALNDLCAILDRACPDDHDPPIRPTLADVGALYSLTEDVSSDLEQMTAMLGRLRDYVRDLDLTRKDAEIAQKTKESAVAA